MATNIKATKKFKALVAVLGSEEAALVAYNAADALSKVDPRLQELQDAGFTQEQAERALFVHVNSDRLVEPATSKEKADALVEAQGFTFTKGRIYTNGPIVEAQVRVLKTGKPEIVASSGVGRTAAILIYKEASGDVACQNLAKPA